MFTGLVESVGELIESRPASGGFRLRIASPLAAELVAGDSLAVNGVCLTVILAEATEIQADVRSAGLAVSHWPLAVSRNLACLVEIRDNAYAESGHLLKANG